MQTVGLLPGRWTPLPGTGLLVWWDGEQEVTVPREGGFWNLARLAVPGRVLAWARLADRPELGAWPIMPVVSRATYGSRFGGRRQDGQW